ncbi:ATP-binding protein [Streptomyces sp. NPDC020192]|uniref:ATP-binding protein n=1 Tax=Streptomyces sp. NPDC020192 TaxID=3365066 RepID=UPI003792656A
MSWATCDLVVTEDELPKVTDALQASSRPLCTSIELALRHPRDATELPAALVSAHEETERLVQLGEDLLLLARTDRRDTTPAGSAVSDLVRLLHRGRPPAQRLPRQGHHRRLPRWADRRRSERPTRPGGDEPGPQRPAARPRPRRSDPRPDGDHARIEVRDHGTGFPPDFLPHAFDRFTQADRSRSTTGTGLGLAITAAGGEYGAFNHPDGGAVAWISLPALPRPPASA